MSDANTPVTPVKQWVNFDAVVPETIDVTRRGRTLHLREDVPWEEIIPTFRIVGLQDEMRQATNRTAESVETWFAQISAETLDRMTAIVRHSYPEMTREDVAAWLDFDQQMQVVMLFFQRRLLQSSARQAEPTDDSADSVSLAGADAAAMANRAARRLATKPGRAGATTRRR